MPGEQAFTIHNSGAPRPRWIAAIVRLGAACCIVFALDAAVFRSGLYHYVEEPESFAGTLQRVIRNERARPIDSRKQVLVVGDSRSLSIRPRIVEEATGGREFAFATVAAAASLPRSWYYLLREVDPEARRYTAIIIGLDDYEDEDWPEDLADRLLDVQMAAGILRLSDTFDFSSSFKDPEKAREAALGSLLKGFAYKKDVQDLLIQPRRRWGGAKYLRTQSVRLAWEETGEKSSLAGLRVDWAARRLMLPDGIDARTREELQRQVDTPSYPQTARRAEYRRRWLTRIADRYRDSPTLLLFVRLPRSPIPRPASLAPPLGPGVVRELARRPGVMLADEHAFESLESPEFFYDEFHLNGEGWIRASRIAVEQLRLALARKTEKD